MGSPDETPMARSTEARTPVGAWNKLMRIASMGHEVRQEMHSLHLDDHGRARFRALYAASVDELDPLLPDGLKRELHALAPPLPEDASESELRLAQVQFLGWLDGLMQEVNAMMVSHALGAMGSDGAHVPTGADGAPEPGQYL